MGWFVFTFIMLALAAIACRAPNIARGIVTADEYQEKAEHVGGNIGRGTLGFILFFWLLLTVTSSIHSIDRGHDGLVETFGKITGHRGNGLAFTAPWQSVEVVNVQQQSICADGKAPDGSSCQAQYEPFSKESIDIHVKAVVTYQIDSDVIQDLYTNIGPNYVNKIILPNMNQILKEEVVKYPAIEIVPNRQIITDQIALRIKPILEKSSIRLVAVNLTNIDFDDSVKKAIEGKVIAAQNAAAAEAQVQVTIQQQKQKVEEAKGAASVAREAASGASDAQVTRARGEAAANDLINASLTPQLIQMRTIDKLAGSISVVGIPTSNGSIFDLGGLLTPKAK